ncbi:endonuclease/exonuclease/phosphatase family protein [Actibacterium lipolyticum]|uniref:Endonuclease/Exonuclease/phosphatase family protein n=1 Tax=Actibacterium lipolyticum TaxID=1524263 RepID=A0A238KH87_9RHOB|nr:endonuclease/exonuclease/phosphatase family protein [Actibacterium lipolyticum]SMX42199.1 Endonuclease/Exonuclease/phosphatase family protein [Actibacterium lipolyticum]
MKTTIWGLCVPVFFALAAGFMGALHPVGDSFAVFRLPLAAIAVVLCLILLRVSKGGVAAVSLAVVAFAGLPAALKYVTGAQAASAGFVVYQKNLLFMEMDRSDLIADILSVGPDFVTFQEVSVPNLKIMEALQDAYPFQKHCYFAAVGSVAVLSKYPVAQDGKLCAPGITALQTETPNGPVWIVAMHLHWPWPHEQADQLRDTLPVLKGLKGPVIVAGDLNMVPWSHTVDQIEKATGTQRVGPVHGSYDLLGVLPIPIDHVFAPGGGQAELRGKMGSDHRGLVARVGL